MHAGPSGCTLPQTIICESCYAAQSIPDTRRSTGHNIPEVGVHTAQEHASKTEERVAPGDVRGILPLDVLDETQSVVQEQAYIARDADSVGPKLAPVEQV